MSDMTEVPDQEPLPWFANREVPVLQYRINRRPRSEPNLFADQPVSFVDHLAEVLLFGEEVRVGTRGTRVWKLGNRHIDSDGRYISGLIGWESPGLREQDEFDRETNDWVPVVEQSNRSALGPFSIETATRRLFVVRHSSFADSSLATVFRTLLNQGEGLREFPTTDWDVQPMLDESEFEDWLREISVLQKVTFLAKLPNPDAEAAFAEIDAHLKDMNAGEMRHTLLPADAAAGLSTNFKSNRLSNGLLEMSKRGFAAVTAAARDHQNRKRQFRQLNSTKREYVALDSVASYEDGRDAIARHSLTSRHEAPGIIPGSQTITGRSLSGPDQAIKPDG